jgi:hypothetical protein
MHFLLLSAIYTANILRSFSDPFEFEGDYGAEMNPLREQVFECIVPSEEPSITLAELVPPSLLVEAPEEVLAFVEIHGDEPAYPLLHSMPSRLLYWSEKEEHFPFLGSLTPLKSHDGEVLKEKLWEVVFSHSDRPATELFIYWAYHALNLQLIAEEGLVDEVNLVKERFGQTLGDAQRRAEIFREKLIAADVTLLFTQECDELTTRELTRDGLYHPVSGQAEGDGTYVFLRADDWLAEYELVSIEGDFRAGTVNAVLATDRHGERFLLASAHGHSTNAADGRAKIAQIVEVFRGLENVHLVIGTDANTKGEKDERLFREELERLGLVATDVGPTTVKRRVVTVQHSKAGKLCHDQEDYLIVERDGAVNLSGAHAGFGQHQVETDRLLPDLDNLSDHYPVGVIFDKK